MACTFFENNIKANLINKRALSNFITTNIFAEIKIPSQLQYIFVSDDALLEMNSTFLNHNTYTDIITFNLSENNKKLIGEIYISIDRVIDNTKKFKVTYQHELHRVIFHGALHLCGYTDKTKADKIIMRNNEDAWIENYFNAI